MGKKKKSSREEYADVRWRGFTVGFFFFYQRRLFCILIIRFFGKAIQVCFLRIRAFENEPRHIIYPVYLLSREAGSDFLLFLARVIAGQVGKTRQWARQSITKLSCRIMIIVMIALPFGDWWRALGPLRYNIRCSWSGAWREEGFFWHSRHV